MTSGIECRSLRLVTAALVSLFALLGAGCGGGGSAGTGNGAALKNDVEQTMQIGPLLTRLIGTVQPPVTSGGVGAVVTGIAGGTISSALLRPVPNLANTRIAFTSKRSGHDDIWVMNADGSNPQNLTKDNSLNDTPAWSPDGTRIAFSSHRSGHDDIWVMNADGSNPQNLTKDSSESIIPRWSPDPTSSPRTLVGAVAEGGLVIAAAGMLVGEQHKTVTSFLAFDTKAADRNSARISSQTGLTPGLPNLVFTLQANSLTSLVFLNGLSSLPTNITMPPGAAGALVSYDSADGTVTSVLPYAATKAVGAPLVSTQGTERVLRGHFSGVWDAKGRNLAPQGASAVRQDARTGAVLSVQ